MNKILCCILFLISTTFAQNPLQVDTSVSDIKPIKKEVAEPDFSPKKKEYRPTSNFKPAVNPFTQPQTEFQKQQRDDMDQSARGTTPGF